MNITGREIDSGSPSAGFPYESRFVDILGHRIHYIEEGRGAPVLFVHGNLTSSYIWRNVIPSVAKDTHRRAIALDLPGFGKSDKPGDLKYTLDFYYRVLERFIGKLGLNGLILVLHGWGGPIGMMYAARHPENVQAITLMETVLWDTSWRDFGTYRSVMKILRSPFGSLMAQGTNVFMKSILPRTVAKRENLTREAMNHYRMSFPTVSSRKVLGIFPKLIPIEGRPETSRLFIEEIERRLRRLTCPVLWIKATPGAVITRNTEYRLMALAARLPRLAIKEFGPGLHLLQEEDPARLAKLISEWIKAYNLHNLPTEIDKILFDAA